MNYEETKKRYENDAEFRSMVDISYQILSDNRFTISELRDALIFAGIKFEQENSRPIVLKNGIANFVKDE